MVGRQQTSTLTGATCLEVRRYISGWRDQIEERPALGFATDLTTDGPGLRYRVALFLEKEGFEPLLRAGRIAKRFDLAIFSTKGMSVTAARSLVEALADRGVTILVAHDFDKSGFTIAHTLAHDTRRFQFRNRPDVIDLGLRLEDAQAMGLLSEPVTYDSKVDPRITLRQQGAAEAECTFLVHSQTAHGQWTGERIELNAMRSRQFLDWLEAKLTTAGVTKYVSGQEAVQRAYRRALRLEAAAVAAQRAAAELPEDWLTAPPDLIDQITELLSDTPEWAWDTAVAHLAREQAISTAGTAAASPEGAIPREVARSDWRSEEES